MIIPPAADRSVGLPFNFNVLMNIEVSRIHQIP